MMAWMRVEPGGHVLGIDISPAMIEQGTARVGELGVPKNSDWIGVKGSHMLQACDMLVSMSRMIQIRNVPDDLHRTLKVRAARAGMTLSDYLLSEVRHVAEKPTFEELVARLQTRRPVRGGQSSAEIIRRHRDAS